MSFVFLSFFPDSGQSKSEEKRNVIDWRGDSVETETKKAFQRRVQLQYSYFLTFEFQKVEL